MEKHHSKNKSPSEAKRSFLSFFCSKRMLAVCWTILFICSFLILFVQGISYLDPDLGWHLRVGKDIIATGNAPRIETYTFPIEGQRWVDHEWLSNALLYLVYESNGYGYWMLNAIFALIAISTFALVVLLTRKIALPESDPWKFFFHSSLLIFIGTYSLMATFGVRLQVLTWFLTIALLALFVLAFQKKNLWPLFVAPFLIGLWANLHGTFVTGLILFGAFIFVFLLFSKKEFAQKMLATFSFVASVLATLATPYGLELWDLIFNEYTQSRGYLLQIKEWLPMYAAPYIEWYAALYLSLFIALLIVGILSKSIPKNKLVWVYIAFTIGLMLLSIQSRRFLPLFTFASFPVSANILLKIFSHIKIRREYVMVLCAIFLYFIFIKFSYAKTVPLELFRQNIDSSPYQAVLFLKSHPQLNELKVYNQYAWGGYFTWMWPEKKLFIDGRMPQRPLDNGSTYIDEYLAFHQADTMIAKLKEHDIKLVVLPPSKPRKTAKGLEKHLLENFFMVDLADFNKEDPLYGYLRENWQEIYSDDVALVYLHPEVVFEK